LSIFLLKFVDFSPQDVHLRDTRALVTPAAIIAYVIFQLTMLLLRDDISLPGPASFCHLNAPPRREGVTYRFLFCSLSLFSPGDGFRFARLLPRPIHRMLRLG